MIIDSHTRVFQVENRLSLALVREGVGEKVIVCVRYLLCIFRIVMGQTALRKG